MLACILIHNLMAFPMETKGDIHSFANAHAIRTTHLTLDLTVDFARKQLHGYALHELERLQPDVKELILDTRRLTIEKVEISPDGKQFTPVTPQLDKEDKVLGSALRIPIEQDTKFVKVHYRTSPEASGLQWLAPSQTADKKHPFLYSQSQAIHARSWIPVQDSPGVRFTYTANILVLGNVQAVMSARRVNTDERAKYGFIMEQPIPAYLLALAVGDLRFQKTGSRTGIWAEPSVVAKAAKEFEDMELMLEAVESMYGPYRWERYDVLMLPPSFPFGGMENPRMTFATPTVLAGDKSLVALIAHEMAHSWSGNLVTNATWRDFWLNEGFTVYLERRILEKVYGKARAEMETQIGRAGLDKSLKSMKPAEQILHINLDGLDPDENLTDIPYEKGFLFLLHLEKLIGRERFDAFLKGWFTRNAFKSVVTADFVNYLKSELLNKDEALAKAFPLDEWINQPGLPKGVPAIVSPALQIAEGKAKGWASSDTIPASRLDLKAWSTQEWLFFLRSLPETISAKKLKELDDAYHLTETGNNEVLCQWLEIAIRNYYEQAYPRVESFLTTIGRRIYVKPLYEALLKTPEGRERAKAIYTKARPGYHSITTSTLDEMMKQADTNPKR
jgi:leukotriene A-4 hydrolase/aminopeptidase